MSDPPRTLCDAQVEVFNERTALFLKKDPKKPYKKESRYQEVLKQCGFTKSAGGCFDLFNGLRSVMKEIKTVSPDCTSDLGSESDLKKAIWETLDLMVKLAWGEKPPMAPSLRNGIFDGADVSFFCDLKQVAVYLYGEGQWNQFVEKNLKALPGWETLDRNDIWSRSIMSVSCSDLYK